MKIGDILHYWPGAKGEGSPQAAMVVGLSDDASTAHLVCYDAGGRTQTRLNVPLKGDSSCAEAPQDKPKAVQPPAKSPEPPVLKPADNSGTPPAA